MKKSLLFLPDISGFTEFVQSTESAHSQHVISELLEVLLAANTQDLQLAEIEGDALFFYKEEEIPSLEMLLAQVERMFTAFYTHLKLLEKNRICPCNACATAPKLQLKIIAHCGELQFISVQNNRKPFGTEVIEAHRLMKNGVQSDNYVLFSKDLTDVLMLPYNYQSKLYNFKESENIYDGKTVKYLYSIIDKKELKLKPFSQAKKIKFDKPPTLLLTKEFPISAPLLLEYITNYSYRYHWVKGVDKIEFNKKEITRVGSEHVCVINGKHFNFSTITKDGKANQLIYGELTTNIPIADEVYQFYIITPRTKTSSTIEIEVYINAKSILKKIAIALFFKKALTKNINDAMNDLLHFIKSKQINLE